MPRPFTKPRLATSRNPLESKSGTRTQTPITIPLDRSRDGTPRPRGRTSIPHSRDARAPAARRFLASTTCDVGYRVLSVEHRTTGRRAGTPGHLDAVLDHMPCDWRVTRYGPPSATPTLLHPSIFTHRRAGMRLRRSTGTLASHLPIPVPVFPHPTPPPASGIRTNDDPAAPRSQSQSRTRRASRYSIPRPNRPCAMEDRLSIRPKAAPFRVATDSRSAHAGRWERQGGSHGGMLAGCMRHVVHEGLARPRFPWFTVYSSDATERDVDVALDAVSVLVRLLLLSDGMPHVLGTTSCGA
ncbi:hypothetical protein EIP86_009913 [Pleurotus ostreatoroseus]|nr:hypothetical protein EIP86_009913 [Pleurotus ostreatoroseus]